MSVSKNSPAGMARPDTRVNHTPHAPAKGVEQLGEYIFHIETCGLGNTMPMQFNADDVARMLVRRLPKEDAWPNFDLPVMGRLEEAALHYDTQEIVPVIAPLLDAGKDEASLQRAAVAARITAALGTDEQKLRAQEAGAKLANTAIGYYTFKELVPLAAGLHGTGTEWLAAPIRKRKYDIALKEDKTEPLSFTYEGRMEYTQLDELENNQLPRVQSANQAKQYILSLPRAERLKQEIAVYLEMGEDEAAIGATEYMTPWIIRRLRQESWAAESAQQATRNTSRPLKAELAQGFRNALPIIEKEKDAEMRLGLKLRALRGVRYFGGPLTVKEQAFVTKNQGHHFDPLDTIDFKEYMRGNSDSGSFQ